MRSYEEIVKDCNALIPRDVIETRESGYGKKLSYLPGFYVINRLNEVFGQGNWAYTSEVFKLHEGTIQTKSGDTHSVHYMARVRLVVTIGDRPTEFTDYGYGDGSDKTNPGKAHELAIKESITDGLKRAARCLGNSFGNGLYDKTGEGIEPEVKAPSPVTPKTSSTEAVALVPRDILNKQLDQYKDIAFAKKRISEGDWAEALKGRGVVDIASLTDDQANTLLTNLKERVK